MGKKPNGTYMSHACKSLPKNILFFFIFKCILLQISHKKCFFINIFIPGRSGVKEKCLRGALSILFTIS